MFNLIMVGTLAAALTGAPVSPAGADDRQPGPEITVEMLSYNGSGCPPDTAVVAVTPDATAFTVTYSHYLARVGADSRPGEFRRNCQLSVDVTVPAGFTYAVVRADYRGYGYLEPGATALQKASYYFQGVPDTVATERRFAGPMDDTWNVSEETEFPVYAPCEETRFLNINTELRVNAGSSDPERLSMMAMDSEDHDIETTYHLDLAECAAT